MTFEQFLTDKVKPYSFYWIDPNMFQPLIFPYEITAKEFIGFANRDLEIEGKHGLVNAVSNAKRAIDCQVDAVTLALGVKKHRSFPKKVNSLSGLGLLAPRVIARINQQRNYLEHEYKVPEKSRVEDAVDTATLFVELTQRVFRSFQAHYVFGGSEHDEPRFDHGEHNVAVEFCEETKVFEIECFERGQSIVCDTIDATRKEFVPLLKMTLSSDWNYSDSSHQELVEDFILSCADLK